MQVQPYVFFNGRCEEAMKFYGEKLGAEVLFQMRFKDAPPAAGQAMPPGNEEKIMHTTFRIGSTELMGSDGDCNSASPRAAARPPERTGGPGRAAMELARDEQEEIRARTLWVEDPYEPQWSLLRMSRKRPAA